LETSTPKSINWKNKKINCLWKPVHQRASTGKPNKSTAFGNQYIKEHQQESQINQKSLETSTPKSINQKAK
jgi:hypothetical protein